MAAGSKPVSNQEEVNLSEQRISKILQELEAILKDQAREVLLRQSDLPERLTIGKGYSWKNDDRLLRLNEVLEIIPVGKSNWWAGVKSGRYPAAVHLSRRITAWRLSEVMQIVSGGGATYEK